MNNGCGYDSCHNLNTNKMLANQRFFQSLGISVTLVLLGYRLIQESPAVFIAQSDFVCDRGHCIFHNVCFNQSGEMYYYGEEPNLPQIELLSYSVNSQLPNQYLQVSTREYVTGQHRYYNEPLLAQSLYLMGNFGHSLLQHLYSAYGALLLIFPIKARNVLIITFCEEMEYCFPSMLNSIYPILFNVQPRL